MAQSFLCDRSPQSILPGLLIFLAACAAPVEEDRSPEISDPSGRWFSRAPMVTARQELAATLVSGKLYLPGGFDGPGGTSLIMEIYDPATDIWESGPSMPLARHHAPVASVGDDLYVLGGYVGNPFEPRKEVMRFTVSTGEWAVVDSLPIDLGAGVAVQFGGKIYVIGGRFRLPDSPTLGISNHNIEFDPQTGAVYRQPMPTAREHLAAAVVDSLIYVVGGRIPVSGGSQNLATLEAYSPATNTWYTLPPMPTPRGGLAAAAINGKLYVFGGEYPEVFANVEEYDPLTKTWRTVAPMPTPRHGCAAVAVGDSVYVIGGGNIAGLGAVATNEMFTIP